MSFRRSKLAAFQSRAWQRFFQANREGLARTGVRCSIYESGELFDDFLMHGWVDHHPDPTRFTVAELNQQQKALPMDIDQRYLRSGSPDPGLGIFGHELHDEIRRGAARPG
jgi:hypothetical protein